MKNPSTATGRRTHRRIKLSTIAALGALGLSIDASAQGVADSPIDAIEGIANYEILPDDTLLITLENGETLTLTSDAYVVIGEQIFLRENGAALVQAAIESGIGSATLLAAAAGLGAFRLASELGEGGEDGGDPPSETDTTPPVFTSDSSASMAENADTATVVYDANATDNATLTYSLSGIDAALFEIDSATGEVRFLATPDFEAPGDDDGDGVFEITVTASDGTNTSSLDVAITLTDTNDEAPVFTSADSVDAVSEAATDTVYTATVTDADSAAAEITFSLAEGGDNAHFSIDASTGEVTLNDSVDFDAPLDSDGDNVYNIQIIASDGTNETTHDVAITITDAGDELPVFTSDSSTSVAENTAGVVYTAAATPDVDGTAISYAIDGGADAALFEIDADTGELKFLAAPDHDVAGAADGGNDYIVTIRATEADGQSSTQTVTITVTDTADEDPVFTSSAAASVNEGETGTGIIPAATADLDGEGVRFEITGGADGQLFRIHEITGELEFISAPDHEARGDGGDAAGDNVYEVELTGTDESGNTSVQTILITVNDVADEDPVFTSGTTVSVDENQTDTGYTAQATPDVDGAQVTYSIAGGLHADWFEIDPDTGELSFKSAPDHESQVDGFAFFAAASASETGWAIFAGTSAGLLADADGDGVLRQGDQITINGGPPGNDNFAGTIQIDGHAVLVLVGNASGDIAGTNDVSLIFPSEVDPNDTTLPDLSEIAAMLSTEPYVIQIDNSFEVDITATDEDGNASTQTVIVTVNDIADEDPVFTSGATASIAENQTDTGYVPAATPDLDGAAVTYTITGGADAALFELNASGELVFLSAPDHESPSDQADAASGATAGDNVYEVEITATDEDGNQTAQTVSVTVGDTADENPVFTSATTASMNEGETDTGYTAQATPDLDGQKITYSLLDGAHDDLFDIDPDTGELSFKSAPDYEAAPFEYRTAAFVSYDGLSSTPEWLDEESFVRENLDAPGLADGVFTPGETVEVGDGYEFTYLGTVTIKGHKVLVLETSSTELGQTALHFRIPPGTDLELSDFPDDRSDLTIVAEDFQLEQLNEYQVQIHARDESGRYSEQIVTITVNDVEEAPIFSNTETDITIDEGTSRLVTLFDADATDPNGTNPSVADDGITYSLTGDDASQFEVDADTGELTFAAGAYARDHDNPADTGGDNTYNVTLVARDAEGETTTLDLTINLRDLRDEDPVFTSSETASIDENTTQTGITPQATPDFASDTVTYSIVGGAHADLFEIDQATGELVFKDAPDYEAAPAQFRAGGVAYHIVGSQTPPTFNATQTYVLTDADGVLEVGDPVTRDGTSSNTHYFVGTVIIDGHTIIVTTNTPSGDISTNSFVTFWVPEGVSVTFPDFSALTISTDPYTLDTSNQYQVMIEADDGTNNNFQTVTITVDDVDETAPVFSNTETAVSVDENTGTSSVVFDANATDPDGTNPSTADAGITYTLSGDDAALFDIDADTGEVTFKAAPDHENPADTGGDNSYNIIITAKDAADRTTDLDVQITVDDVSETDPVFTSATTASVDENETDTGYTAQATPDVAGDTVTYSIVGGAHADLFTIDADTGELSFKSAPDHEAPAPGQGTSGFVEYRNGNLVGSGPTARVGMITEDPANSNSNGVINDHEYILIDGADLGHRYQGTIKIDGVTLIVTASGGNAFFWIPNDVDPASLTFYSLIPLFDIVNEDYSLNENGDYQVEIQADDGTNTSTQTVFISVNDTADDDPVFTSGTTASVAENETDTGYVPAATPDVDGAAVTYTITGGADAALFELNASGELVFKAAPDHENPSDQADAASGATAGDNVYEVEITATDEDGNQTAQTVSVTVGDTGDDAPGLAATASVSVQEGGTATDYQVGATPDVSGAAITYAITGGEDKDLFAIDAAGVVTFKSAPTYNDGGDNTYQIVVTASEANGQSATQTITFTVTEDTSGAQPPTFTNSESTASVNENISTATVVYDANATDPDGDDSKLTYSLSSSGDYEDFDIDADTGEITFKSSPDHEAPDDSDGDNDYELTIVVTDETNQTSSMNVTISVDDVADDAPVLTSATSININENPSGVIYTAQATPDVAGAKITYSLASGVSDSDAFTIDANTGELTFITPPDHENPHDEDTTNSYGAQIIATEEGGRSVSTRVIFFVKDVGDEAPAFTSSTSFSITEGDTATGYQAAADPDVSSAAITYAITGGEDKDLFAIDAAGVVTFKSAPTYNDGGDNTYQIVVTASEANGQSATQTITFTVTEDTSGALPPSFTNSESTASVNENISTSTVVYDANATDPDGDDNNLTYRLASTRDNNDLRIDSDTGEITFRTSPDYESPADHDQDNVYDLTVYVTDEDNNTTSQSVSIAVNDVAFEFTSASSGVQVDENSSGVFYTAAATPDVDGAKITYSLAISGDSLLFAIDPDTGELSFISPPDYENPLDNNSNNFYGATIIATEEGGGSIQQTVGIEVLDVDDGESRPPEFNAPTVFYVDEGDSVIFDATAHDPLDSNAKLQISVTGEDKDKFFWFSTTSKIFSSGLSSGLFDHENPADFDGNNEYRITLSATSSDGVTGTHDVVIYVNDVADEDPVFNSESSATIDEKVTGTGIVLDATIDRDLDTVTYSISGGAHGYLFEIDPDTNELKFKDAPDFEAGAPTFTYGSILEYYVSSGTWTILADERGLITENPDAINFDGSLGYLEAMVFSNGPSELNRGYVMIDGHPMLVTQTTKSSTNTTVIKYTVYVPAGVDPASLNLPVEIDDFSLIKDPFTLPTTNEYDVEVRASDGTNTTTQTIVITVQDVDESAPAAKASPVITSGDTVGVDENTATLSVVYDASATDTDSAQSDLTYSLSGTDAADFNINADTGEVTFKVAPDHENPDDNDGDNVYDFTVIATDDTNNSGSKDVTLTVNDIVDEDPVFTSLSAASVNEGETATGLTVSADPDLASGAVTYSIVGGAHADLFTIDADTGELSFVSAPDYEVPVSAYAYDSVVTYSTADSTTAVVQNPDGTRVITEDPSSSFGTVNGTLEVSEAFLIDGAAGGTFAGYLTVGGQDLIVSSYEDAGTTYFTIYVPSGTTAEDLGVPSSLPSTAHRVATLDLPEVNDYQVEVQASDGTRTSTQMITISVLDVDESAALSGDSLSTVKLSVDSFDSVEGEIVSSPTDLEDQLDPISTTPLREPLPDYDWADDGFAAMQMQLDMSDALDGL